MSTGQLPVVQYVDPHHTRNAVEAAVFGRAATDIDYGELAGFPIANATVTVTFDAHLASKGVNGTTYPFAVDVRSPGYYSVVIYYAKPSVYLHSVHVDPQQRQNRLGRQIFSRQAQKAASVGFTSIEAWATRNDNPHPQFFSIGYYALPRWGFDIPVSQRMRALPAFPAGLQGAAMLSDLMVSVPGATFWRTHGFPVTVFFDLTPGSPAWNLLNQP